MTVLRKKWVVLGVVVALSWLGGACRKEGEKKPTRREVQKRIDRRAMTACEKTVSGYLDAVAAKDYAKALDFVDVEEMVREAREKPTGASPPTDASQMKQMLISMLEKNTQKAGELEYKILGSEVSGDEATVDVELSRDGKVQGKESYGLVKTDGGWKLKGSAIRALLPPRRPAP